MDSDLEKDLPHTPSQDNNSQIALNGALEPPEDVQSQISTGIEINGLLIQGATKILSFDKSMQRYGHNSKREYSL